MLNDTLTMSVLDKNGVEIGGPSYSCGPFIYERCRNLDNVVFSNSTAWAKHDSKFTFRPNKEGNVILNDATDITNVSDETYDFCFSSHCLEHIANPLKAVKEWLRITKTGGTIIMILPEKSCCFDHKRDYSVFSTILSQYEKNVGEDDLSTLPEILERHDLRLDPAAGSFDNFRKRSLKNFENRCLHHYVYSPRLLMDICNFFNCEFIHTETVGLNIWFIMRKR